MSEQFLKAYDVTIEDFFELVGSKNKQIIKSAKKNQDQSEEVDNLIQEWGGKTKDGKPFDLDHALDDIISGNLDKTKAYEYLRTLELLLEVKGKKFKEEYDFPGRGWQDIQKNISDWKLPSLSKNWFNQKSIFPWKEESKVKSPDWPLVALIKKEDILKLLKELESFNPKILTKFPLPKRQKGLEDVIEEFIPVLKKWVKATKKDLVLLLDGQQ